VESEAQLEQQCGLLTMTILLYMVGFLIAPQLGAEAFEQREAAQVAIEALGEYAQPALASGIESPDAEIRRRCDRALCKLAKFGLAIMPRLDSLPEPRGEDEIARRDEAAHRRVLIQRYYLDARVDDKRNRKLSEDAVFRRATLLYVGDLLESGKAIRSEIRKLLLEMEKKERGREDNGAMKSMRP
jgi:hypothetical protein